MRFATLVLVALLAPVSLSAQKATPWGDPDLQGVWINQTPIPLERPPALAGKATFTKEESAEVEKHALDQILGVVAGEVPTSGELNAVWLETQKGKVPP